MPTCRQRAHSVSGRRSPPLRLDPPSKAPGLTLSGLKYYHDPHAISQPDKPPINIRLIYHSLRRGMWIIPDFSLCTGMTRALPGKHPLLVPARLRNPQHFHRLCTGLAPLRTSHPHVCAQEAGEAVPVSAGRQQRIGAIAGTCTPASAPRAKIRDTLVPSPVPCQVGTDVRRCRAHVVRRWKPSREPGCALVGTGMIKVLANRKPLPLQMAAEFYANYRFLRAFL
jgi:hypothetical protein